MDEQTDEWMNVGEWMDVQTEMDGWMDGQTDGWMEDRWINGLTDRWMDGHSMYGYTDGHIDGWIGMDGWLTINLLKINTHAQAVTETEKQ